ncbi:MAG: nucleotide exchange factor GrpE [bacterium]|nr:nucleotide exchange factor GrpE [bacterium]
MTDNHEVQSETAPSSGEKQSDCGQELSEIKDKLSLCERERDEYLNGWRRAKADFMNYKNEELERLREVVKFGNEDIVKDVIIVLDSLERGVKTLLAAGERDVADGMRQIRDQLEDAMKRRGLTRITVRPGEAFDPMKHEALAEVPMPLTAAHGTLLEAPPGAVVEELTPGFILNGKIIRAAKVNISKGQETVTNNQQPITNN